MLFSFLGGFMKKSFFLVLGALLCFQQNFAQSMDYKNLFADLKKYKKTRGGGHAGHLYEHMVWVAKSMDKLFEQKSQWVDGFDSADRRLMVIAAFMHDIGKAGDLKYQYFLKPTHPRDGFEYFIGKKPYLLNDKGNTYNFDAWCKHMNLHDQDKATVAVLIGMHQEFGKTLSQIKKNPTQMLTLFDEFVRLLEAYTYEANYNGGFPDTRIIKMSLAMTRADLEGMFPVEHPIKQAPELKDHPQTLKAVRLASVQLLDTVGYAAAQLLLQRFRRRMYAYLDADTSAKA